MTKLNRIFFLLKKCEISNIHGKNRRYNMKYAVDLVATNTRQKGEKK